MARGPWWLPGTKNTVWLLSPLLSLYTITELYLISRVLEWCVRVDHGGGQVQEILLLLYLALPAVQVQGNRF